MVLRLVSFSFPSLHDLQDFFLSLETEVLSIDLSASPSAGNSTGPDRAEGAINGVSNTTVRERELV